MGLEYARQLATRGYDLLLVSNQQEELAQASATLSATYDVRIMTRYQDLAVATAAEELFDYCQREALQIDILVNNAGCFFFEELCPENEAKALRMLQLHVYTPSRLCMLFGELMKQRGHGYILNVSSMVAKIPAPGITMYSATKAYLKSFSKSLYFEMRPYGVGVTVVCPAAIATTLYKIKPSLLRLGVKVGLVGTPEWLVRRALRGLFRRRRVVRPGAMNYYLPFFIGLLPNWLVARIWKKLRAS